MVYMVWSVQCSVCSVECV